MINLAGIVGNHTQSGSPLPNAEPTGDPPKGSNGENGPASDSASTGADAATLLYQFRETQRRQVEFIKKRVLLLEKGLNAEYQKEYFVSSSLYWIDYCFCVITSTHNLQQI